MNERLPDVMTIEEASAYLRISLSTLYKVSQQSKIPCQKVGRQWRFHRRALDRWLEKTPSIDEAQPDDTVIGKTP